MSEPWVYFRFGEYVGLIPPAVYELFDMEIKRLRPLVDSDKLPPLINAMIINSANTPAEGLR